MVSKADLTVLELAIEDLKKAQRYNPSDTKIKKKTMELQNRHEKLQKEKNEKDKQLQKEKTKEKKQKPDPKPKAKTEKYFPPVVQGEAIPREYYDFGTESDNEDDTSYEINPNAKVPEEIHELGRFLEIKGVEIVNIYLKTGRKQEAEELKEKLKKALVKH